MQISKADMERLRKVFEIPDFIVPWLDRFFIPEEIILVLLLAEKPLKIGEIAERWTGDERYREVTQLKELTDRSCRRGVIGRDDQDRFKPAGFHERFDSWALFEGWMDLPDDMRDQLNIWEFDYYNRRHASQINTLKNGGYRDPSLTWPEYVLLPEAEALIDRVDHIYLWPCNCRSMMGGCEKDRYTCLRFSNQRGIGWEISRTRAKQIVNTANQSGLMQNAEISVNPGGSISGAICNCCADCCFPHQLAAHQNAAGLWPLTRYVADHLLERCTGCGRCVKRCPFNAFRYDNSKKALQQDLIGKKQVKRAILFDSSLCRGCGVCCTACPESAIEMIRLEHVESAWQSRLNIFFRKQTQLRRKTQ